MPHVPSHTGGHTWQAHVLTLFPEMFPGPLGVSLAGSALSAGIWSLAAHAIRDHGQGRHRLVDDHPSGGGAGMVMRCDVLAAAIDHARTQAAGRMDADADAENAVARPLPAIYLSPRGRLLTQSLVRELAAGPGVLLLCGRFEGVDERVIAGRGLIEVSIGDYVLSGGEVAAMVMLDACVRLLPGVMGHALSGTHESFEDGLLEHPHYTKPREWEGRPIPDVLLSGNHAAIAAWRQAEALRLTAERRPDLIAARRRQKP